MYKIHLLPASFGDAILIEYGQAEPHYILIDGGPFHTFKHIVPALKRVAPNLKELELLVVTHIDIDHIDGAILLLNQEQLPFAIKEVWFNGFEEISALQSDLLGALQGEYLSILIKNRDIPHNTFFGGKAVYVKDFSKLPEVKLPGGMTLTLLTPGKEELLSLIPVWEKEISKIGDAAAIKDRLEGDTRYDYRGDDLLGDPTIEELQDAPVKKDTSKANGSSIAFIATFNGRSCLFAGDAHSDALIDAIEPMLAGAGTKRLVVDAWKLGHHGSRKSTIPALMKKVSCKNFLISSDGKRYRHPDKECLARLLKYNGPNLNFYFNYKTTFNKMWGEEWLQDDYSVSAFYPEKEEEPGITVSLG